MSYVVFDLEATCWEGHPADKVSEIIEIGAVKLNERLEVVETFDQFVRPVLNPRLSSFCTQLTSIRQADVEQAPALAEALKGFYEWAGEDAIFLSWGFYDKAQIQRETRAKRIQTPLTRLLDTRHHSVKHRFADLKGMRPCGMERALELLGLPLEGTHHRGVDDAKNIAKIVARVPDLVAF